MDTDQPHISYGIVPIYVSTHREYLIVKSYHGYWGFPKGHPESNETPKQTAIREAFEETGIQLSEDQLHDSVQYAYVLPNGQTKQVILFPVTVNTKVAVELTDEIRKTKWASEEEVIRLIDTPDIAKVMQHITDMKTLGL